MAPRGDDLVQGGTHLHRGWVALTLVGLVGWISSSPMLAVAQSAGGTTATGQPQATTITQYVRDQGHTLTPEEAAFFDAKTRKLTAQLPTSPANRRPDG